jgi:hypothetical protein
MNPRVDILHGLVMHKHSAQDIDGLDTSLVFDQWYGIRRLKGQSSTALTRIGNMDLHKAVGGLPIQNKMRRCLVLDGEVNYYLDSANSLLKDGGAAAILDGTDGNVMIEIPQHYARFWEETVGSDIYQNAAVSEYALQGFTLIEKHYISAYEASLNRTTNKLASVVNLTEDYRGGNNTSAWDAAVNSLLGKPVTNLTRPNERAYAAAIGTGWCEEPFEFMSPWRWLAMIEYANTNIQLAVNNTLTAEGYRQGGLGDGVTTANGTEWSNFNSYNPFIPCGTTNSLGNRSGEVSLTVTDFGGAGVDRTFKVPSYRGIENPFGHIYKRIDGININRAGGKVLAYGKKGVTGFVDDTATGYTLLGEMPYTSDYILNVMFSNGVILPETNGGGATSGFADYYYAPSSVGWKAPLSSALAAYATYGGLAIVLANSSAAYALTYFGLRLCFKP